MVQDPSDPRSQFADLGHPNGLQDFLNVTMRFRNVFLLLLFSIITVGNVIIIIALA